VASELASHPQVNTNWTGPNDTNGTSYGTLYTLLKCIANIFMSNCQKKNSIKFVLLSCSYLPFYRKETQDNDT